MKASPARVPPRQGLTTSNGVRPVTEAETKVAWLPMCVIVSRVARHLCCAPEDAWLRIVEEGEAGRIKACGLTVEGWPTSPLSASWRGATSGWSTSQLSYEVPINTGELSRVVINDVELCVGDLVAAGLLTTALGSAWWSAAEALAWIIIGVPLEWKEWAGLSELGGRMEQAGKELARAIGKDQVRAQGRLSLQGQMEIATWQRSSHSRICVRPDGELGTSPPGRLAVFKGRRRYGIEVNSATVRQVFPKPLRVERQMLDEAEQLYAEGGSEPTAGAEEVDARAGPSCRA